MNKVVKRFTKLETILASLLLLIPLILIIASGKARTSISDYAYSGVSSLFVGLLWLASSMFVYNGYLKDKWYNIVLGISLIVISLTPHLDYPVIHYLSALVFFLGSVLVMIVFSSTKQRKFKIAAGIFIFISMLLHFVFDLYSLLVAEWIGMIPICIHFIGESNNKID